MRQTYIFIGMVTGTCIGATAVLVTLRLTGQINWPWSMTWFPIWAPAIAFALIVLILLPGASSATKKLGEDE
jgi:hypothetical protein